MSNAGKIYLLLFLILWSIFASAQDVLRGKVIDQSTGNNLPYATILNTRTFTGTATNLDGYFELPNVQLNDTIEVSFIGFKTFNVVLVDNKIITIRLEPNSNIIDEVVINASDDRLYDLIQKVRRKKDTKKRVSKTYFYLESSINNQQSEVIESYYNGEYKNYGIEELELKKGRIGVDSIEGRYFFSTGTSRTFILHNLFKSSKLFPGNPLMYNKRKLKSRYWLTSSRQFESNNGTITVVDFEPKSEYKDLFEGTMQVSDQGELISIQLRKLNSSIYPFIPFGDISIKGLDMEIHKTFINLNKQQYVKTVDFNYNIHYIDRDGNNVKIESHAYCNAFDYNEKFQLPFFDFSQHMHQDYRDITVARYDTSFWQHFDEFRFYDKLVENEKFILQHQFQNSFVLHQDSINTNQLETPYYNWSDIRFKISPMPSDKIFKARQKTFFESDLYNLNTKLYLDVNIVQDSLIYQLVSILDPVDTYYKLDILANDHHFMNLYFDLLEYHRIKLDRNLKQEEDLDYELVKELLDQCMVDYNNDVKQYLKEVNRGKNINKMSEWNDYLFELTNVDNSIELSK